MNRRRTWIVVIISGLIIPWMVVRYGLDSETTPPDIAAYPKNAHCPTEPHGATITHASPSGPELAFHWNDQTNHMSQTVTVVNHEQADCEQPLHESFNAASRRSPVVPANEAAVNESSRNVLVSDVTSWANVPTPAEPAIVAASEVHPDKHDAFGPPPVACGCGPTTDFAMNIPAPQPQNVPCGTCGGRVPCRCRSEMLQQSIIRGGPRIKNMTISSDCGLPQRITGVDSATCVGSGEPDWGMRGPIPWEFFAQGEYIGPARRRHMDKYRLRVDDELQFVYRVTRQRQPDAYELNVGDEIRVESVADKDLDRKLLVQPDGTITLRLLGQVIAAGRTTDELRRDLEKRYTAFYKEPAITVTPTAVDTKLNDLRATVDSREGVGGQSFTTSIIPDGTVQLPAIGSVPAHGLTLDELKREIEARYRMVVEGIEVTPVLRQRAGRSIYVVGEVAQPGRYDLVGPTTVTQAIALAQGWNNGANLRNIVIFRRAEDWRLLATKVDVQGALYGRRPAPSDEIWLRDSDVVIVPKAPIKVLNDAIELIFTNGVYAVAPILGDALLYSDVSTIF